jgi:hypothetical protein
MGYTTENTQDAVVESVLLTTEKVFIAAESANCPDNSQAAEMVYFQIED